MTPRDTLIGTGEHVGVGSPGTAKISGTERRWATLGLYRIIEGRSRSDGCSLWISSRSTRPGPSRMCSGEVARTTPDEGAGGYVAVHRAPVGASSGR